MVTKFRVTQPTYDWSSPGFGHSFAVFVLLTAGFQMNYLFLYFLITNLAKDEPEIIRYAALLRGTESAWQAVSYGLTSIPLFAQVGGVYFNFALWGVAIYPAWTVLKHFGRDNESVVEHHVGGTTIETGVVRRSVEQKAIVESDTLARAKEVDA